VDTGKLLHVVILKADDHDDYKHHVVYLGTCRDFSELDDRMNRFQVERCVIDGMPETHATRKFADRHGGGVYLCFFNENQKGKWASPDLVDSLTTPHESVVVRTVQG